MLASHVETQKPCYRSSFQNWGAGCRRREGRKPKLLEERVSICVFPAGLAEERMADLKVGRYLAGAGAALSFGVER
jgi:hypothetical protein